MVAPPLHLPLVALPWLFPGGALGAPVFPDTWNYADQNWGVTVPQCAGTTQSPIDVNTSRMISGGVTEIISFKGGGHKLGPVAWSFHNGTVTATSSLYKGTLTLTLDPPFSASSTTVYFGYTFLLQSITLHVPSEHTVDGQHYDMEAQLLHVPAAGQQTDHNLVTSVLLRLGPSESSENGFLKAVEDGINQEGTGSGKSIILGNPYYYFYPRNRSYFAVNGSLTAPPCSPATWVIFSKALNISARQLQYFRGKMDADRPNRLARDETKPAPPGVSCAATCPALNYTWDRRLGTNARNVQDIGTRWVKGVHMLVPEGEAAAEKEAAAAQGWGPWQWFLCVLATLAVLACAGCIVVLAMKDADESREWDGSDDERPGNGEIMQNWNNVPSRPLIGGYPGGYPPDSGDVQMADVPMGFQDGYNSGGAYPGTQAAFPAPTHMDYRH